MEIGTVKVASRLALAPMAGVTDLGFRTVCRALGCGYTVTEMVSAKALCYQDRKSVPLLKLGEGEHPPPRRFSAPDPKCMEEAAAIAGEVSGAEIIDINMGCPVPKVANSGDGPASCGRRSWPSRGRGGDPRRRRPARHGKMRLGWDKGSINCGVCQGHGGGRRLRRGRPRPDPRPAVRGHRQLGPDPGGKEALSIPFWQTAMCSRPGMRCAFCSTRGRMPP